jgi:hypothetical protein
MAGVGEHSPPAKLGNSVVTWALFGFFHTEMGATKKDRNNIRATNWLLGSASR